MKAEYLDERDGDRNTTATTNFPIDPDSAAGAGNMFAKFHHPHPQYNPISPFHFTDDLQPSAKTDPTTTSTPPATTKPRPSPKKPKTTTNSDGAGGETIQTLGKPRGRPLGSKNKPKPPILIPVVEPTLPPIMSPYILEIQPGADIISTLTNLTRRRNISLCILTASGSVTNFSIRQPGSSNAASAPTLSFQGPFEMLSLSALVMQQQSQSAAASSNSGVFTVWLAGPQGQVVGGKLVGGMVAATTVYVVATSFGDVSYHRLPLEEENGGGGQPERERQRRKRIESKSKGGRGSADGEDGGGSGGAYGGCHVGLSSSSSHAVWPLTARPPGQHQQHPPPPPY